MYRCKRGSGNSVHQEPLALFNLFLVNSGISLQTENYIKKFHYEDDSIDGNAGTQITAT